MQTIQADSRFWSNQDDLSHHHRSHPLVWTAQLQNPEDDSALFTALRETWEEVGIDLAEQNWLNIGQLGADSDQSAMRFG